MLNKEIIAIFLRSIQTTALCQQNLELFNVAPRSAHSNCYYLKRYINGLQEYNTVHFGREITFGGIFY